MTTADHWRYFTEFCRNEMAVGGPDPHLDYMAIMGKGASFEDRAWIGGCYISAYSSPMAEVIYHEWPLEKIRSAGYDAVEEWTAANWKRIVMRQERRCIRTPAKFARFLTDYASWLEGIAERNWITGSGFEDAWTDVQRIKNVGRYMALKITEYFRRIGAPIEMTDLRPAGGWSPRKALTLLYPEDADILTYGRDAAALREVNQIGADALQRLAAADVHPSWWELQVMLCEYREEIGNHRQYPGRSHDLELKELIRLLGEWQHETALYRIRKINFPHEALGELQGWAAPRDELSRAPEHGYTWTDLDYDYVKMESIERPVFR